MNQQQEKIHKSIAVISFFISLYLSLVGGVYVFTNPHLFTWNIFLYIFELSGWLWVFALVSSIFVLIFFIQPICEVLCGVALFVYCAINKSSKLYDDFEIQIIKEESRKLRSSAQSYSYKKMNDKNEDDGWD